MQEESATTVIIDNSDILPWDEFLVMLDDFMRIYAEDIKWLADH